MLKLLSGQTAWRRLFLLCTLLTSSLAGWAGDCVQSAYALRVTQPVYVDLRPFSADSEALGPGVLNLSLVQLRASRAFRHRNVVLLSSLLSPEERQAICDQLSVDGFQSITFVREPADDVRLAKGRLVLRRLPDHGWRVAEPADVHQMLGAVEYVPLYLTGEEASPAPDGFMTATSLEDLFEILGRETRQIVVFHPDPSVQPPDIPPQLRRRQFWWVKGGMPAYREYQGQLLLSFLSRDTAFRACER